MAQTKRKSVSVGFLSRLDFLSDGWEEGLCRAEFEYLAKREVAYIVIAGGLISDKALQKRLAERKHAALDERKRFVAEQKGKPAAERRGAEPLKDLNARVQEAILDEVASELAKALPEARDKSGKPLKIFIVISPVRTAFDGPHGMAIAERLAALRSDVRVWGQLSKRFIVKGLKNKNGGPCTYVVVVPDKTPWRSEYYSTLVDRVVKDKMKQSVHELPDLWVVGCSATANYRPAGELPRPQVSLPASHRLKQVMSSENQVGPCVIEFFDGGDAPSVSVYSFKDFQSKARVSIPNPSQATPVQLAILDEIRKMPQTAGMLADALGRERTTIEREIAQYERAGLRPPVVYNDVSHEYDLSSEWLQRKLRYSLSDPDKIKVDKLLGFGCLHAGYCNTQYGYVLERLPEIIIAHDIEALVGCGDFVAGLKHNLHLRGEILAGMNNTEQEKTSARLVATVMLKVFQHRFDRALARKRKQPDPSTILSMVEEALLTFYYYKGNHDKWVEDSGFDALTAFAYELPLYLRDRIRAHLDAKGLPVAPGVSDLVRRHVRYGNEHILPSGLMLSILHPEMARAATTSLRAQATLGKARGQVVFLANFHTATSVHEWQVGAGQRVAVQVGTLVSGTDFEDGKLKNVDTGVAILKVGSLDQRILTTEIVFEGPSEDEIVNQSNRKIFDEIYQKLGL